MQTSLENNAGQLEIEDLIPDRNGSRITKKFLSDLVKGVCQNAHSYWQAYIDYKLEDPTHSLRLPERNLYSSFAAAISDITHLHMSEMAVVRKGHNQVEEGGRVDFWAFHRKRNFFLELKRASIGICTPWSKETLNKIFQNVDGQAKELKSEARAWTKYGAGASSRISLQVVLPYQTAKESVNRNKGRFNLDIAREHYKKLLKLSSQGDTSPNFCAVWTPPQKMTLFDYKLDKKPKTEWNPYVGFLAKIWLQ